MALSENQKKSIEATIKTCLRNKFLNYKPESNHMPFHFRLLGKDRMALYSFIQSINTTFGSSIFEPVAVALAESRFMRAESQYVVGNSINQGYQAEIQRIMNDLSLGEDPNKLGEIESILAAKIDEKENRLMTVKVDLFVEAYDGSIFLFDLKTAKPNISNFKDFKQTLLLWAGIALTQNPNAKVNSLIAIPYNPYNPEPYQRWTMKGMLDLKHELKVAEEFWDFLGGDGAYNDLLDCFERAGIELRPEVDQHFAKCKNSY